MWTVRALLGAALLVEVATAANDRRAGECVCIADSKGGSQGRILGAGPWGGSKGQVPGLAPRDGLQGWVSDSRGGSWGGSRGGSQARLQVQIQAM